MAGVWGGARVPVLWQEAQALPSHVWRLRHAHRRKSWPCAALGAADIVCGGGRYRLHQCTPPLRPTFCAPPTPLISSLAPIHRPLLPASLNPHPHPPAALSVAATAARAPTRPGQADGAAHTHLPTCAVAGHDQLVTHGIQRWACASRVHGERYLVANSPQRVSAAAAVSSWYPAVSISVLASQCKQGDVCWAGCGARALGCAADGSQRPMTSPTSVPRLAMPIMRKPMSPPQCSLSPQGPAHLPEPRPAMEW